MPDYEDFKTVPYGRLGIIALEGCSEFASKVDEYLVGWRKARKSEHKLTLPFAGYEKDSYIIKTNFARFGTGEGKCVIEETVRGFDLFILCDPFNHGVKYKMYGQDHYMSPDDHIADLKRAISAVGGKARRITVIMSMLYEGRQHRRSSRESLDCAAMLQELCMSFGVENIVTFDAHDARVQNAVPQNGFENVQPVYQMIKAMCKNIPNMNIDKEHMIVVSPDEGGMSRCIYFATVLGLDLGMFYKRRDYSRIINGRNPIIAHEFLGDKVEGKDVIIVDDMISSGDSMIEVAEKLKELKARKIYVCAAFGLFCDGLKKFDDAYKKGVFSKIFTTNLVYSTPELLSREWHVAVDMSKYCAYIVDTLNHDESISGLLDPKDKINNILIKYGYKKP